MEYYILYLFTIFVYICCHFHNTKIHLGEIKSIIRWNEPLKITQLIWVPKRGKASKICCKHEGGCQDSMYSNFMIIVEAEGRRTLKGLCLLISIGRDRNYSVMAPSYKWKWPFAVNGSEAIYCELWCGPNIIDSVEVLSLVHSV